MSRRSSNNPAPSVFPLSSASYSLDEFLGVFFKTFVSAYQGQRTYRADSGSLVFLRPLAFTF